MTIGFGPNKFRLDDKGKEVAALPQQVAKVIKGKVTDVSQYAAAPKSVRLVTRHKRVREEALAKARSAQEATPKKPRALRDYGEAEAPAVVAPPAALEAATEVDVQEEAAETPA